MYNSTITGNKIIYEHREIASKALGRELKRYECVHHIDYDGTNNSPENLIICPSQAYHMLLHARQKILENGGHPDTHKWCSYHKRVELREEFSSSPKTYDGLHPVCKAGTNTYRVENGLNTNKFDWRARLNQQYRRAMRSKKVEVSFL